MLPSQSLPADIQLSHSPCRSIGHLVKRKIKESLSISPAGKGSASHIFIGRFCSTFCPHIAFTELDTYLWCRAEPWKPCPWNGQSCSAKQRQQPTENTSLHTISVPITCAWPEDTLLYLRCAVPFLVWGIEMNAKPSLLAFTSAPCRDIIHILLQAKAEPEVHPSLLVH